MAHFLDKISDFFARLNLLVLGALSLLVFGKAIAVHFQLASLVVEDLASYLFAFMVLSAMAFTLKNAAHVRIDAFYARFSPSAQALIRLFGNLFVIIPFSLIIIYYGFDFAAASFEFGESSPNGKIPYYFIFKGFIVLAFLLLALQSVAEVLKILANFKNSDSKYLVDSKNPAEQIGAA